ncbi:MAG TPA: hypothetical protein VKF40_29105 [Burkholderiales bacterium]|nr:hypothetical protein [Burkholderiales bacterium]
MNIHATRGSVAAGDDVDAPHARDFTFPDGATLEQIVGGIADSSYLAKITGGQATWTVVSNIPVAVVAQQWSKPRMLPMVEDRRDKLEHRNGVLTLHFNYHAQIDPETVYKTFWGFRLNAI